MPPVKALYQLRVPAEATALRFTVPVPQMLPLTVEVTVGIVLIEAITSVRDILVQDAVAVSTKYDVDAEIDGVV